jgi:hypothetical protein
VRALWEKKSRDARGYGAAHKALRLRYLRAIESGQVVLCARCSRRILPGAPFDLDHTPDRSSHLGPSHRRCNRQAGARNGAAVTNSRRAAAVAEPTHVWSRVWEWPIPAGVYVAPEVVRAYLEEEVRLAAGRVGR